MNKLNEHLFILVFGCVSIPKYKQQILSINRTWGQRAEKLGVRVLYFLGEVPSDLIGPQYIYLKNVKDDYMSASYKQNLGFKYIRENYDPYFVFCCGGDTYVNIDRLLEVLSHFDYTEKLYIGGHSDFREVNHTPVVYHSGGGFVLSRGLLDKFLPIFDIMTDNWVRICRSTYVDYLIPSSDVCIGYFAAINGSHIVHIDHMFLGCDYKGTQCRNLSRPDLAKFGPSATCHLIGVYASPEFSQIFNKLIPLTQDSIFCDRPWTHGTPLPEQVISCHYMDPLIATEFNQKLIENNYYINAPLYKTISPICTLVTACFKPNIMSNLILSAGCYQIIFCNIITLKEIRTVRRFYSLNELTIYYQFPTNTNLREVSPAHFMNIARTINHFNTELFFWINPDTTINSTENLVNLIGEPNNLLAYETHTDENYQYKEIKLRG
jgi:hypothetical protein